MYLCFCSEKNTVLGLLVQCFHQTSLATGQSTSVIPRLQWFLELMGHTKNIAVETLSLRVENTDQALPQVISARTKVSTIHTVL